jgi:hypothetical protein
VDGSSTPLPCPGPSSTTKRNGAQVRPTESPALPDSWLTPTTSSFPPIRPPPLPLECASVAAVGQPPHYHTCIRQPIANLPYLWVRPLHTSCNALKILDHNTTTSTTPVPLSCHITPHVYGIPTFANTPDPSPRSPSEQRSTGSGTDDTPSRPNRHRGFGFLAGIQFMGLWREQWRATRTMVGN